MNQQAKELKKSVAAILISSEGELILQHREDKEMVAQRGKITNFGGAMEEGETPLQAVVREIHEELSIKLDEKDFNFLEVYKGFGTHSDGTQEHDTHLFIANGINKNNLFLTEGAAIVYLKVGDSLDELPFSERTLQVLAKYLKMIQSLQFRPQGILKK